MPRVYAIRTGIHPVTHGRVRAGVEFEVPDGVTDSWFAPVETKPAPVPEKKRAPKVLRDLQADELA